MTLRSLLAHVGIDVAGKTITVDGRPVDLDTPLGTVESGTDAPSGTAVPDARPAVADTDSIRFERADHAETDAAVCGRDMGATTCQLPSGHVPSRCDGSPIPPVHRDDPDWAIHGHYQPRTAPTGRPGRDELRAGLLSIFHVGGPDQTDTDLLRRAGAAYRNSITLAATPRGVTDLHIVFDGPPGPDGGRFVEVETPEGHSVAAGRWEHHRDGNRWRLVLPVAVNAIATRDGEG